jgi:hypothetical protein
LTFKDLQKLASHSQKENTTKQLFQRLYGKPFWIWDKQQHKQEYIRTDGVVARYRSQGLGDDATKDMRIVPVSFNTEHKAMLGHCKMILESEGGRIAINPDRFDKLITALRTAVDNDGVLDKEATSYNDIFDAFRLALKFYHFEQV